MALILYHGIPKYGAGRHHKNGNLHDEDNAMQEFIVKHQEKIASVLSCFDRIIFKGYLPISFPESMTNFLRDKKVLVKDFKGFVVECSKALKQHAEDIARRTGRPYQYLKKHTRKEDYARGIAQKDKINDGLVCILSVNEPCSSFKLKYGQGKPELVRDNPRCLCLYFYFIDRDFGLMHVRIQTWFPFTIQVYINGHEWLARKLDRCHIDYQMIENAFVRLEDSSRVQRLADRFVEINLKRILSVFAAKVNPLMKTILHGMEYYWVVDQAEFATDIIFKDRSCLEGLYPKLLRHATLCFSAEDVMTFLGKKLNGNFKGELMTSCAKRCRGARVKHRMKENWMKMYDKHGCVLRIETVINHPHEFLIRRRGKRHGDLVMGWYPMAKRVTNLWRYQQVCLSANMAYLSALASVDDPSQAYNLLNKLCEPATLNAHRVRGLNPLRGDDLRLFAAVLRGEHFIHGFRNRDLARHLESAIPADPSLRKRCSARITRLIHLLRAHHLVAKIPRSRRYRITSWGTVIMSAAICLRTNDFPQLFKLLAA